jgi:hypothetical protein
MPVGAVKNFMAASATTNMRMEDIVNACEALHHLIDGEDDYRIHQEVVDAGVVPRLVALLDQMTSHDCLNYILSILYNIALGTFDQAKAVVSAGAVDKVISLLGSPYPHVANEAVLVLANIAAKGPELGEHVMEKGIVKPLLALIKPDSSVS